MRGASKLFDGAGVDFVNIEFSPSKHDRAVHISDTNYLKEMDARGFDVFLLDCYRHTEPNSRIKAAVGAECLAFNRLSNKEQVQYVEPDKSRAVLKCIMEGDCGQAKADTNSQHIEKDQFESFVQ